MNRVYHTSQQQYKEVDTSGVVRKVLNVKPPFPMVLLYTY